MFPRVENQDSVAVAKKVPPKFLLGNGGRIPKDIRESGNKCRKPVRLGSDVSRSARQESSAAGRGVSSRKPVFDRFGNFAKTTV